MERTNFLGALKGAWYRRGGRIHSEEDAQKALDALLDTPEGSWGRFKPLLDRLSPENRLILERVLARELPAVVKNQGYHKLEGLA